MKVRLSRLQLDPSRRSWDGLEELQTWTDERIGHGAVLVHRPGDGDVEGLRQKRQRRQALELGFPALLDALAGRRAGRALRPDRRCGVGRMPVLRRNDPTRQHAVQCLRLELRAPRRSRCESPHWSPSQSTAILAYDPASQPTRTVVSAS